MKGLTGVDALVEAWTGAVCACAAPPRPLLPALSQTASWRTLASEGS
jgi:hypothetical protein